MAATLPKTSAVRQETSTAPIDYLARIRDLAPALAASAKEIDERRELPAAIVDRLVEGGFFRLLLPRSLGGAELLPADYVPIIEAVARIDASTAWCLNQNSGCSMTAAYLSPEVAHDIFGPPRGILAWGPGPGEARVVDGGYNVTAQWSFASGSHHASWLGCHVPVIEANGQPRLEPDGTSDQRVRDAIEALLTRQDSTGSFGLWGVGGDDLWLDSYVTDFLTRARERKFAVPDVAFKLALDRLRNSAANITDPGKNGGTGLAYALYVLARNGTAPIGDLRYLADAKLDALTTPIAKAQVAAALALAGDRARAERVYASALSAIGPQPTADLASREDYGSTLRDAAAIVTLAAEGSAAPATVQAAVQRVESARALLRPTSTQEDAWMLLAASAMAKDTGNMSLDVDGEASRRPLYRTFRAAELTAPWRVANSGDNEIKAVVTVTGAPLTPEPAAEHGFKIERQTYTLDGDAVDPAQVKQNTRLAVVLKITEAQPQFGRVMVADFLPAGFEIDNPHLVSSGDAGTLSWIEDGADPVNTEFRDDRFTAAFERKSGDPAVFSVAYVVRAVSPGKYVRPQASVEDMYRPDRFGRTQSENVEVVVGK